jgi:hypothetical protein
MPQTRRLGAVCRCSAVQSRGLPAAGIREGVPGFRAAPPVAPPSERALSTFQEF